ncbi:chemotaxis protein CheX [Tuberibacillus sp. Marseille-P3662]|uniref:chemotaxis protein CheX n=1 Tax=Tuberibacillus sp. Marseille-P3662 TaxID=1965358 RepID=UPI000A1C87FC|nr:chemotaxis protein CheX [Tuberibacillus sp. Marseille-P3662]
MTTATNGTITHLINGTLQSLKTALSLDHSISKPGLLETPLQVTFGVFIGITGDFKGKLVINGHHQTFANIGEKMFGMPLEGEMLKSFTGEIGNMIAGGLSTNIYHQGIKIDITAPTVMDGDSQITGFRQAIHVPVHFNTDESFDLYLLVDE